MTGSSAASSEITFALTQFLYREAELLDGEDWRGWLDLLSPDIHYWIPGAQARYRRNGSIVYDPQAMAFFDDTYDGLVQRVRRFEQETAWAEDPPTRAAHVVSNIRAMTTDAQDLYAVHSLVTLHRQRNDAEVYQNVARRRDLIRATPTGYRLARRHVFLLETVLLAKNINTFF